MRPLRLLALLGLAAAVTVATSCSTKKAMVGNQAPSTRLFVQYDAANGDPHTVSNQVHLYWFGSDADGFVARYEYRFVFPGGDPDPAWSSTVRTDSLFNVPDSVVAVGSDTAFVQPEFEVRAIDNEGAVDPNPPRQRFDFRNEAPRATFADRPDTTVKHYTMLTQTLGWTGVDPDGDAALLQYRVWLDGAAAPHVVNTNSFTFPTSDFVETAGASAGQYRTRVRTAYVQAIDPGGLAGPVDSVKWTVRAPVSAPGQKAKLLLVDDTPLGSSGNQHDTFWYTSTLANAPSLISRLNLPAGSWSLLRMEAAQNNNARPFRSANDLRQTLALFDAVIWYRGQDFIGDRDTVLTNEIVALEDYVDAGGNIYFEGSFLVANPRSTDLGLLPLSFVQSHVDADFLFLWYNVDSTATWSVQQSYSDPDGVHRAILHSSLLADSLRMSASIGGLRVFGVRDTNNVVLWARTRTLVPRNTFDAAVAIRSPQTRPGIVVLNSVPMIRAAGFDTGTDDLLRSPARVIQKILKAFGTIP